MRRIFPLSAERGLSEEERQETLAKLRAIFEREEEDDEVRAHQVRS